MTDDSQPNQNLRELVDQYIADRRAGKDLDSKALVEQNPEFAAELRREFKRIELLLQAHDNMDAVDVTRTGSLLSTDRIQDDKLTSDDSDRLQIRCPECCHAVEIESDTPWTNITCDSCRIKFNLAGSDSENDQTLAQIGHFQLRERVGMGAFGTVWRGYDQELDRDVAIKIPRKGQLTESETEYFLREARAAAQIQHPNIVRVYEVGQHDDHVFIASEFIDGVTLDRRLADVRLTIRESTQLIRTLAAALQVAHKAGVVHRDLKPGNILLDREQQPHITDFGLAKRDAGDITMTVDGAVLGTPAYMSPEQACGNAHTSDARSDIYSLGVIMFQLLTGELPFRGNSTMLMYQVIHDDPPSPRKLNNRIPRDLETICLRCLAKRPEERFPSADDLAQELDRALENRPILSRREGRLSRSIRWCQRRPALAGALGLVLLTSLIGTVVSTNFFMRASEMKADAGKSQAETDELKDEAIVLISEAIDLRSQAIELKSAATSAFYISDMNLVQQMVEGGNKTGCREVLEKYLPGSGKPDLRGFEWNYWWRVCNAGLLSELGCDERLFCVAASPDGRHVVMGGGNGSVYIADSELSRVETLEKTPDDRVWDVCFSPDSKYFLTAHRCGVIKQWNSSAPKVEKTVRFDDQVVRFCQFWNDGKWLAVITKTRQETEIEVTVFDIQGGFGDNMPLVDKFTIPGRYPEFSLSPDNQHLALATNAYGEGSLTVRNVPLKKQAWHLKHAMTGWGYTASVFLNGGSQLLCSQRVSTRPFEQIYQLYESESGDKIRAIKPEIRHGGISAIAFAKDRKMMVMSTGRQLIKRVYSQSILPTVSILGGHKSSIYDVAISPDERSCYSVGLDQSIKKWSLDDHSEPRNLIPIESRNGLCCVAFSPDGKYVATAKHGKVEVFSVADFSQPVAVTQSKSQSRISFSKENSLLMLDTENDKNDDIVYSFLIWNFQTGKTPQKIQASSHFRIYPRFTANGRIIYDESSTNVYDPDSLTSLVVLSDDNQTEWKRFGGKIKSDSHHSQIYDWDFSSDGKLLATCGRDRTVKLWDVATTELLHTLPFEESGSPTNCVNFSPDGKHLAIGQENGKVTVAKVMGNQLTIDSPPFTAHDGMILNIEYFPDGKSLASFSNDGTIKIWDTRSLQLIATLNGHTAAISSSALSPDGRLIISSDDNGNVFLWNGTPVD